MHFSFIEPMLLQAVPSLPEGWLYELKLDGYRAIAGRVGGTVHVRSRNDNDFARTYSTITAALASLPDDTVVDGEVVAREDGRRDAGLCVERAGGGIFFAKVDHRIGAEQRDQQQAGPDAGEEQAP